MLGYMTIRVMPVPRLRLKTETICTMCLPHLFPLNSAKKERIHFLNVKAFKNCSEIKLTLERNLLTLEMNKYRSSTWHFKWHFIDPKLCIWLYSYRPGMGCTISKLILYYTILFLSLSEWLDIVATTNLKKACSLKALLYRLIWL